MNSTIVPSIFKCMNFITSWVQLQSWRKVLGTVLQHAHFSVISRFPLKTVRHFQNLLALLPSPTLYKVETRKKFWIHTSKIVCGVRGGVGPVCPKTFVHEFYWCCLGRGGGALWTLFYCSVEGSQTYVSPCQLGHCPWVQDTHTLLTKI